MQRQAEELGGGEAELSSAQIILTATFYISSYFQSITLSVSEFIGFPFTVA